MDRAQRLAILSAMSDESLGMALEALGIQTADAADPFGEGEENPVPRWNDLEVSVPSSTRGPIATKDHLFVPKQSFTTDAYGLQQPGQQEEGMSMMGIV